MLIKKDFIAGDIKFSAWIDTHGHVAWALDTTRDRVLPDAMLVIDRDDNLPDRKWDDILTKDFDTDPEIVRPREDNKYQKLDISYDGLSIYQAAVDALETGGKVSDSVLRALGNFRINAGAANAMKRIADNQEILDKVSNTLVVSDKTALKIKGDIALLKERLASQKSAMGFEPTKAAAAKILKTQSQIEAAQEKSKKNALRKKRTEKKIANANEEIKTWTDQLEYLQGLGATLPDADEPIEDSNVAPLIQTDPNIVDEEKAFQAIDIEQPEEAEEETKEGETEMPTEFKPMSWDAPEPEIPAQTPAAQVETLVQPVVQTPTESRAAQVSDVESAAYPSFAPPVSNAYPMQTRAPQIDQSEPVPVAPAEIPVPSSFAPNFTPAPATDDFRPAPAAPQSAPETEGQMITQAREDAKRAEPGSGYYLLLLLLVIASIATLYIYQKRLGDRIMPHLEPAVEIAAEPEPVVDIVQENIAMPEPLTPEESDAFLDSEQIEYINDFEEQNPAPEPIIEPVIEEIVEPLAEPMVEPESAIEYQQPTTLPYQLSPEELAAINAAHPVADAVADVAEIAAPQPAALMCDDGAAPDENGCCPSMGEQFVNDPAQGALCCMASDPSTCFPPLD